jgi:hypothetical protein
MLIRPKEHYENLHKTIFLTNIILRPKAYKTSNKLCFEPNRSLCINFTRLTKFARINFIRLNFIKK